MKIDPAQLSKRESYRFFTSVIVPRPIAWVTTLNEDGSRNTAPFSFFMGVTSSPPRLAFSVGQRRTGIKDTARNIMRTGEFVVSVVTEKTAGKMNLTSADHPYGTDEAALAGLTSLESETVMPPGIAESPVNMECKLIKIIEIGEPASSVIFGEVLLFRVDDDVTTDGVVDPGKLHAVGRLGVPNYCRVEDVFPMERPKTGEHKGGR